MGGAWLDIIARTFAVGLPVLSWPIRWLKSTRHIPYPSGSFKNLDLRSGILSSSVRQRAPAAFCVLAETAFFIFSPSRDHGILT